MLPARSGAARHRADATSGFRFVSGGPALLVMLIPGAWICERPARPVSITRACKDMFGTRNGRMISATARHTQQHCSQPFECQS